MTRIPSKWGISKAGVCCALVCFAYHREGLGERRYRRTLVLVTDGAFKIRAVEAKWETLGRYVLIHLQPSHGVFFLFFRGNIDVIMRIELVIGSVQVVWMYRHPV